MNGARGVRGPGLSWVVAGVRVAGVWAGWVGRRCVPTARLRGVAGLEMLTVPGSGRKGCGESNSRRQYDGGGPTAIGGGVPSHSPHAPPLPPSLLPSLLPPSRLPSLLHAHTGDGPAGASAADVAGWSSEQLVAFLEKLGQYRAVQAMSPRVTQRLAELYGIYDSKNAEIRWAWAVCVGGEGGA